MYLSCLILFCASKVLSESLIQSVSGTLYVENFTYYRLSGEGWLRLELHSLKGDVDLYMSSTTLHPTFFDYDLKSETCGLDIVDVPSTMSRPIGIGIFAHPNYLQSVFKLDILFVAEHEPDDYSEVMKPYFNYDSYVEDSDSEEKRDRDSSGLDGKLPPKIDGEEESVWWTIFVGVMKFILEVIV